jgi:hypothetical protein
MLEYLTLHSGIGVLITALAAYSLPGAMFVRRRVRRDAAVAETGVAADEPAERELAGVGASTAVADRPADGAPAATEPRRRKGLFSRR